MASLRDLRQEIKEFGREWDYTNCRSFKEKQIQLLNAIHAKDATKFKKILSRGIDPNFCDSSGNSPLHLVAKDSLVESSTSEGTEEIFRTLVYFGASLDIRDRFGQIPLHIAARSSKKTVKTLLNLGSKVDCQDNAGRTPLMEVCSSAIQDALTIVLYLLDRKCNVLLSDEDGYTALHCICQNKSQDSTICNEIANNLLYAGISATAVDRAGLMPLCHQLNTVTFHHKRKQHIDSKFLVMNTLICAGANFDHRSQQHEQWIRKAVNNYQMVLLNQLFNMAGPALSLSSLKRLKIFLHSIVGNDDAKMIKDQLTHLTCTPSSLKATSRIVIRDLLKGKVFAKVGLLPIPQRLKDFLLFV